MAPMRVADIDQDDQRQQQRHEHQPQPQARWRRRSRVAASVTSFIGAGLDEDDGAGCADQPDQRPLQRQHAGRRCHRRQEALGCRRIRHQILAALRANPQWYLQKTQ